MKSSPASTFSDHHAHEGRQMVGFYGCSLAPRGALVRLVHTLGQGERVPRSLRITCPACKHEHQVKPLWRVVKERDNLQEFLTV